jgi:hypothetical protein
VKSSQEIFDAGYAIPIIPVLRDSRTWRYKDKTFTTPIDVKTLTLDGLPFPVLPMEKVDDYERLKR